MMRQVVKDISDTTAKKLGLALYHLVTRNEILRSENNNLQVSLTTKQGRKKHGKPL